MPGHAHAIETIEGWNMAYNNVEKLLRVRVCGIQQGKICSWISYSPQAMISWLRKKSMGDTTFEKLSIIKVYGIRDSEIGSWKF